MTNEEIIDTTRGTELWQYYGEEINKLLNLARQDEREKWKPYLLDSVLTDAEFKEYTGSEREKMQGVDVWVSWDDNDFTHNIKVSCYMKPKKNVKEDGSVYYTLHDVNCYFPKNLAEYTGLQKGQCKKFRIVEVLP